METIDTRLNQFQPQMLSIFRIVVGLLLLQHGLSKWFGFPGAAPANMQLISTVGVAGAIEIIASPLLIVGLFTRYAAFVVAGYTAVGYWMVHFPRGWTPIGNNGGLIIAYCFAALLLVFFGGGIWSLDAVLRKRT